jgi:hypothetical protein
VIGGQHFRKHTWDKNEVLLGTCSGTHWKLRGHIANLIGTRKVEKSLPKFPKPERKKSGPLECMLSLSIGRIKRLIFEMVCHHFQPSQANGRLVEYE